MALKNKIVFGFVFAIIFSFYFNIVHAQTLNIAFTQNLKIGAQNDEVARLQNFLGQFPVLYPPLIPDGTFGSLTQNTVMRFQIQQGIQADGIVGPATREKLNQFLTTAVPLTPPSDIVGATGATGDTGARGRSGGSGDTGETGDAGATGDTGAVGAAGAAGSAGTTGNTGATGAAGTAGSAGATGNTGATGAQGSTGSIGNTGAAGTAGSTGTTGAAGPTGPAGAAGASGVVASAIYARFGSQPATVAAGVAFIFSTTVLTTSGITTSNGIHFTLAEVGRYEINYQMSYAEDGAVVLYLGQTLGTMVALPYTAVGKATAGSITGSVIIETTAINSIVSLNAAPGNAGVITVPPNSSTTNQSATTISFKKISN